MSKKKKKEKVIYYDDNSTISDMSNVTRTGKKAPPKPPSTAKDKWRTYFKSVKMMLGPMCIVLLILGLLYGIMMLFAHCAV